MRISPSLSNRYIQPSATARRLFWHIFAIGAGHVPAVQEWPRNAKPGAQLLWVEQGGGTLQIGRKSYVLQTGKYWFYSTAADRVITPNSRITLVNAGIRFGGPGLDAWLEKLRLETNNEFELKPIWAGRVRQQYLALNRIINQRSPEWEWEIHERMNRVLKPFAVARGLLQPSDDLTPKISRVINCIAADPARNWKASELASASGVSYSRLRLLFRREVGETLHQYIQKNRLDLARELLADRGLRVKEIAERLHFPNEYYFSTFFRTQTGWTPSEFREHLASQKAPRMR